MGEIRKVQRTPGGTFFLTVPKPWAKRHRIHRGSLVSVSETANGNLLVNPEYDVAPSPSTVTLSPKPHLGREIVGKYLLGFDIIEIKSQGHIKFKIRDVIKDSVSHLIGLEIVEEDYSRVVLQCLLDPSGFPPDKILRRAYTIAAGMHRDVVNALIDGDINLAKSIIARDDEVNRLYFLLVRILRTIIQNPSLSEKIDVRPIECLDYRLSASLVEAIADECVRAALKVVELKGTVLAEDLKKLLLDFHMICYKAHENALEAFFKGDVGLAEQIKGVREQVEKMFAEIEKLSRNKSFEVVPQAVTAASILRQIYDHSVDIADLAMPKEHDDIHL